MLDRKQLALRATNDLNDLQAVLQRTHLLFALIENAAGPEGDLNQALLLAQVGMQITESARNKAEFDADHFDEVARHG